MDPRERMRVALEHFIFAAVHDIQGNVPPENVMALWEALRERRVHD